MVASKELIRPYFSLLLDHHEILSILVIFEISIDFSILVHFHDFLAKLCYLLIKVHILLVVVVNHHDSLGLIVPTEIGVETNDVVLMVSGEERVAETSIHHVDQFLNCQEEREVPWL